MRPYILMLEDDDDDRHITETFFSENNFDYGVEFLTNSDEVMPFLENCLHNAKPCPRLILLDKNVPAAGGMDVLRSIRSHPLLKVIPVVMISGSAVQVEVDEGYKAGVSSFILKPASVEQTAEKIRSFLRYWFSSVELPSVPSLTYQPV